MPGGGGKYGLIVDELKARLGAKGIVLMVVTEDPKDAGFSVTIEADAAPHLPNMLRMVALQAERDLASEATGKPN